MYKALDPVDSMSPSHGSNTGPPLKGAGSFSSMEKITVGIKGVAKLMDEFNVHKALAPWTQCQSAKRV